MKTKTLIIILAIIALLLAAFMFFKKKNTNTKVTNNDPSLTDEEKTEYEAVKEHLQNYISKVEERGDAPACYASQNGETYYIHTTFKEDETDGGKKKVNSKTVFNMIVEEFGLNIL